jgi:hypothetical protein
LSLRRSFRHSTGIPEIDVPVESPDLEVTGRESAPSLEVVRNGKPLLHARPYFNFNRHLQRHCTWKSTIPKHSFRGSNNTTLVGVIDTFLTTIHSLLDSLHPIHLYSFDNALFLTCNCRHQPDEQQTSQQRSSRISVST